MTQTSVAPPSLISQSIGLPNLVIVESAVTLEEVEARVRKDLAGFMKASDAVSALDLLGNGMSVLYIERGERLNSQMETIVTNYTAGLASFASTSGLVSASFDPMHSALTIVISRDALEKSYPQLLTYAGAVTSIS